MSDWPRGWRECCLDSVPTTLVHRSLDGVVTHANAEA